MKKLLLIIFIFLSCLSFSQEKINELKFKIDRNAQLFEIVDSKSKELLLYYRDQNTVSKVFKANEKFEIVDSLFIDTPEEIYNNYLGKTKNEDVTSLYWSDKNTEFVFYQNIDFKTKSFKTKKIIINLNNEKIVKTINVGNKFFIITIPRKGNKLTFHQLLNGDYTQKTIDFVGQTFYLANNVTSQSIWDVFKEGYGYSDVQTISNETPTSLPLTRSKKKVYIKNDNELIFTFDNSYAVTQILNINLENFSFNLKNFGKSSIITKSDEGDLASVTNETNSFICNDKLFQIMSNSDVAVIDVKDSDNKILKSLKIEKDKEIEFLNSDIVQENLSISNTRILNKSSQLIRRLNNLHMGLTANFINNKYVVTIGGFTDVQDNSAYAGMFGVAGVLLVAALTPTNYSMQNLNSYANRQVVYVNSLLDENLNHVIGKLDRSAFDKLRYFMESNKDQRNPMAFKFGETIFFGGYDKKVKLYSFYKFEN